MAVYVITGVSKGLGYEFLRQISGEPGNTVVGIVRDKATTVKKISEDAELKARTNIHILKADVTSYDDLKQAAADTAKITGGSIDYLVANAGRVSQFDPYDPISVLGEKPQELEAELNKLISIHVTANIHLYNLFMPLILKGKTKKVIAISSGLADLDLTANYDLDLSVLYSVSKAAMNMVTAKFSAEYKKDGVLFLSICPGMVDVGHYSNSTPEQLAKFGGIMEKFLKFAPHFKGADTPENSIPAVRSVWENASVEKGDGGAFLSHLGNKQWL
ncbi:putative short chain dehydrogenase [Annulohypoxylon maeteangense]|uniref:putative short chain dehydrogenase n=1 Tax=Annulohypoxylon maeteangense TaxID=1927788 RepID=UPI0020087140|nr:putative short chain dehydrogenase [Annulohypoxylon maeteangense]KAI0879967.1 putative short chain dehydrogenase [Annulohypoxylon maeteangense]